MLAEPSSLRRAGLALALAAAQVGAQCALTVPAGQGVTGVDGSILASAWWDPDGPGPLGARLVIGGTFYQVGALPTRNVAAWDPATGNWSTFGSGLPAIQVNAIASVNGDVVVAGNLALSNPGQSEHIQRWDGSAWVSLGGGFNAQVMALAVLPNGDLVAAGEFNLAGGVPCSRIARWNGTTWSPLGAGLDNTATALKVAPNGDLLVAGHFLSAGGAPASRIARWNGTSWSALGSGVANVPLALTCLPNGDVVVGGTFTTGANRIARWDGTAWNPFGTGADNQVSGLFTRANGDLIIGGTFTSIDGTPAARIAKWNGTAWSSLSTGVPYGQVFAFAETPNGDLIAGGHFFAAGSEPLDRIARWDGAAWHALSGGISGNGYIADSEAMADGSLVVGGVFQKIDGVVASNVARWNGSAWQALGAGLDARIYDLLELPNGDLVAVGGFTGSAARWNGSTWTTLGTVANGYLHAVTRLANGDLVAARSTYGSSTHSLVRFDGTAWSAFATLGASGRIECLTTLPNGDLVVGGRFYSIGGVSAVSLARWDGTAWSGFTPGMWNSNETVYAMHVQPNGDLVVGGDFAFYSTPTTQISRIGRWDGTAWHPYSTGLGGVLMAITESVTGEIVVAGQFVQTPGVAGNQLARWNGTAWSAIGSGIAGEYVGTGSRVETMARLSNGDIVLGGAFRTVDGVVSNNIARITTTCPANVIAAGAGCGTATLTASHPWTGTTWTSQASNLPPAAMVFVVFGFGGVALPLNTVFATAQPGCTLHVQPDLVTTSLASNGACSAQFVLPADPALTGIAFRHQMVPLALDATLAVTATNALQLTIGTW